MGEIISITRALAELKILDSRIKKTISQAIFIDIYQKRNLEKALKTNQPKSVFNKNAKSSYESAISLIERRAAIKSAIIKSNAETRIKIKNQTMTVAEAIEKKISIEYQKLLLIAMSNQYAGTLKEVREQRLKLEEKIEDMLTQNLGTDKKSNREDYENIAKPFFEQNELQLVDPLGLKIKSDELDKEIDGFLSEVDFVLSESNAKTEVEI